MAKLEDHEGRPVDTATLKEEIAVPTVAGIRSPFRDSVASVLTPSRLAALIRDSTDGDHESFLVLAEEMEEREPHYRSVMVTRKLAVSGAPVEVAAAGDDAKSIEIADAVRRDIAEAETFQDLAFDLLDGLGKGFSVCEILWDTTGKSWIPGGYKWRDPRYFTWDRETLSVLRLLDLADPANGIELAPFKFVTHVPKLKSGLPIRGGLARVAAAAYMLKSYTVRDWHTFMDVFGMPLRVGKYGPGASAEELAALKRAVVNIAADAAGIIPESMQIDFETGGTTSGGDKLFQNAAEWWDKQVSKAVLGQTMTSEDGASLAQAKVHDGVRLDLAKADAKQLAASINKHLVRAYVDLNFGRQERYPAIQIQIDEPEDLKSAAETIGLLVDKGAPVPVWWVREKFGIPEAQEGDELLSVPKPPPPPAPPVPPQDDDEDEDEPEEAPEADEALNRRVEALEQAINRYSRTTDEIDRLAAEALSEWEPQVDGIVGRLIQIVQSSVSMDDLMAQLDGAGDHIDLDPITRQLAIAVFKSRGLGDATDQVR